MNTTSCVYEYEGKSWKVDPTKSDKNSFFHAAFGRRTDKDEPYLDKLVKFRRSRWATFLSHCEGTDGAMSLRLADLMRTDAEYDVEMEEIRILATLENVKIVLFKSGESEPVIISPDNDVLRNEDKEEEKREVVLHMEGNVFSRMNPVFDNYIEYEKGGNAGSEGIEYQVGLLAVFFLNALRRLTDWQLSTENTAAGKFDDAVLEWPDGDTLLQAKNNHSKTVRFAELISTDSRSDFSILKYFLSYGKIKEKFKPNEVIICTNCDVDKTAKEFLKPKKVKRESLLHYEKCDCEFYTCSNEFVHRFYGENFPNEDVADLALDFFKRLQLVFNYPPGDDVRIIVDKLMSQLKRVNTVYLYVSSLDVHNKIHDWFRQRWGMRLYITEQYAAAIFSEIWRDKQWEKLKNYNFEFLCSDNDFKGDTKIFHVTVDNGYLLQEVKIFKMMRDNGMEFLFINLRDSAERQKQILEAFNMPKYNILVLFWPKSEQRFVIDEESCCKLRKILDTFEEKKVVLVADSNGEISCKLSDSKPDIIKESLLFEELSKKSQKGLLEKENIVFQGRNISLKELLREIDEDYAKILSSEELEKLVTGEEIKVGTPVSELDEHMHYINRQFKRAIKKNEDEKIQSAAREEIFTEEQICEMENKVVLISDNAGTGKSTVLTNLAATVKQKYPHLWVIRIDLNDYTPILKDLVKKNKGTIHVHELLNSNDSTKLSNKLERAVFLMNKKVVLMIDGFDEISPDYSQLVLSLLSHCRKQQNFAKVVVTTRPCASLELEKTLQVKPLTLVPFTNQNLIHVLSDYWMHSLDLSETDRGKCEEYAKALIKQMFRQWKNHIAAIPLHICMLAEIFQQNNRFDTSDKWKGCKEYLATGGDELKLPEDVSITKLYKMFIEVCQAYPRNLALKLVLDKTKRDFFLCHRQTPKNMKMNLLRIGVEQKLDRNRFGHRKFADYFVAQNLIRELQCPNEDVKFQKVFIEEILIQPRFNVIHIFFDSFLQQILDSLSSKTFSKYQCSSCKITSSDANKFHLLHYLAENGHLATFQLIFKCINLDLSKEVPDDPILDIPIENDFSKFRNILDLLQQKELNCNIFRDKTLLELAAGNGHLEMVTFLLEKGANVNTGKFKPLHAAVRGGHFDVTKFLVERGADVRAKDLHYGTTALYKAVLRTDAAMVKYLLGAMKDEELNTNSPIILYAYAYLGRLNILKRLIQGVDVNVRVENDETLLYAAVRGGNEEIIKFLQGKGCDINSRDHKGNTALHVSLRESSFNAKLFIKQELDVKKLIDKLLVNGQQGAKAHVAGEGTNFDLAKFLVNRGADVNLADNGGMTALHIVMQMENFNLAEVLVNRTNVNMADKDSTTALHIALQKENSNLVTLLLKHKADANLKDKDGTTALHIAVHKRNYNLVKLLLNNKANVNLADKKGTTALHIAARTKNYNLVKLLLNNKADVNLADKKGTTALHFAVGKKDLDSVKLLVTRGAEVNLPDNKDATALHIAVEKRDLDLVKLLVSLGAEVNLTDNKGTTALHIAVRKKYFTLIQFLKTHDADVK